MLIDKYFKENDWRKQENANADSTTYPGMIGYVANHEVAKHTLDNVYTPEIAKAHNDAYIHIHDLSSGLAPYCLGLDFEKFLEKGLHDIDGPPNHFSSALGQLQNAIFLISQQIAGAFAINSVDILLAPYIRKDNLSYKQIKQSLQEFVYTINEKGRIGFQCPFLNFQLDVTVPKRFNDIKPVINGKEMDFLYTDLEWEIEAFDRALFEIMTESKRVLPFPVINVGITKDYDWDNKLAESIFTCLAKRGQPTFNNYVNSDYDPDSVKSLCCSLRLDMRELIKQTGGQFGAADNSGSIGVVTLNLPLIAYESKTTEDFFFNLDKYIDLSIKSLVRKRIFIEDMHKKNWYPTVKRYVDDFRFFFNTIGVIGMNEMCLNLGIGSIDDDFCKDFCKQVLHHINKKLSDYQVEYKDFYGENSGLLFNAELIPGEGVTTRFARHAKKKYPKIILANGKDALYLTRGCWLPIDKQFPLHFAVKHQEELQDLFTGGANFQVHLKEQLCDWKTARALVKKIIMNSKLPFISISPIVYQCPICGVVEPKEYCEHDLDEEQINKLKQQGVRFKDG